MRKKKLKSKLLGVNVTLRSGLSPFIKAQTPKKGRINEEIRKQKAVSLSMQRRP